MTWRAANSILGLIGAVNAAAPGRSTVSDGTIGDAAHAARKSDHNPNEFGVVTAVDLTHDPAHGADMHTISETLRVNRDRRIKYVIWNARMFASYTTTTRQAWTWGPYTGANQHTKHMHTSVSADPVLYDDTTKWDVTTTISDPEGEPMLPLVFGDGTTGPRYDRRSDVAAMQGMMNRAYGLQLSEDGVYGVATAEAVRDKLGDTGQSVYGKLWSKLEWDLAVAAAKAVGFGSNPVTPKLVADSIAVHAANPDAHHE